MLGRGVAASSCCPSRLQSSRCVIAAPTTPPSRARRDLVIAPAVAPPFRESNASSSSSFPQAADASSFVIRAPETDAEFYSIAALRAEAYYADQPGGGGRFVESYKKQFREQEARSLRDRVAPRRKRKEGGVFGKGGGGNGSDGSGGGGGVFGGVLGVLVGRATGDSSSASNSPSKEKGDAELFLPPECECLAAVEVPEEGEEEGEVGERNDDDKENTSSSPSSSCSSSSVVLGALDIRPPFSAGGGHPAGVPLADEGGCAVLNVAVHPSSRRRGVARALLSRAAEMASSKWQAGALYTTVAATNAGARALYADFGFVEVVVAAEEQQGGGGSSSTTLVGQELLLRADL